MQRIITDLKHKDITDIIIGSFYEVYNTLGHGFLEKVYEKAMAQELNYRGISVKQQFPISVNYKGKIIGEYLADLLVEEVVVVELKAVEFLEKSAHAQILNYLRATRLEVGLILNFGPKPVFVRKIVSTENKIFRSV